MKKQLSMQPSVTRGGLETFMALVKRYDLDARLVLWSPDQTWSQLQQDRYVVNWGGNAAWIIPAVANPVRHMGMDVRIIPENKGVQYIAHQREGKQQIKYDELGFSYESILMVQVRGVKRNKLPKLIMLSMQQPGWEITLEKELKRLVPVELTNLDIFQWDNIQDVMIV